LVDYKKLLEGFIPGLDKVHWLETAVEFPPVINFQAIIHWCSY